MIDCVLIISVNTMGLLFARHCRFQDDTTQARLESEIASALKSEWDESKADGGECVAATT